MDLLLIHWPTYEPSALSPVEPIDPACNTKKATYNAKQCRLNTWRAMVEIFAAGMASLIPSYNVSSIITVLYPIFTYHPTNSFM